MSIVVLVLLQWCCVWLSHFIEVKYTAIYQELQVPVTWKIILKVKKKKKCFLTENINFMTSTYKKKLLSPSVSLNYLYPSTSPSLSRPPVL